MSRDFLRPRMATRTEKTMGDVRTQLALLEALSRQGEGIDKRAAAALREIRATLGALVEVEQKKLDALSAVEHYGMGSRTVLQYVGQRVDLRA